MLRTTQLTLKGEEHGGFGWHIIEHNVNNKITDRIAVGIIVPTAPPTNESLKLVKITTKPKDEAPET